jgi:hypothetical protein
MENVRSSDLPAFQPRARRLPGRGGKLSRIGRPGRFADDLAAGGAEPVARLDPQRHAGSRGTRAARGAAHLGGAHADQSGPAPVRRRDDADRRAPSAEERAAIEARARGAARSRRRWLRPAGAVGPVGLRRDRAWCRATNRPLRQLSFVPISPQQAVAVMVGGDGTVENRVVDLPPGVPSSALVEAGNFISERLSGPDPQPRRGSGSRPS